MKKTILIIIVLAAVAGGCKKYEEGPLISFRSAKSRLLGEHTLTKFTVNGIDSLQSMDKQRGLKFKFYHQVDKSHDIDRYVIQSGKTFPDYLINEFEFIDHNKCIYMPYGEAFLTGYCSSVVDCAAKLIITKLKKHDIHMKATVNSIEYYLEFE